MTTPTIAIMLAAFILLSSFSVTAQVDADFTALAPGTLQVCGCGTGEVAVRVENSGDFLSLYTLRQKGAGAPYVTLFPDSFVLAPGESVNVAELVNIPCGVSGSFPVTTTITSDLNVEKQFTQQLTALQCDNLGLAVTKASAAQCRCTTFEHAVSVQNRGNFVDTYRFSAGNAVVAPAQTVLAPGERMTVHVFDTPDCAVSGSKTLTFTARSLQNQLVKELSLPYTVNAACYAAGRAPPPTNETGFAVPEGIASSGLLGLLGLPFVFLLILFAVVRSRGSPVDALPKPVLPAPKPSGYRWEKMFAAAPEPVETTERRRSQVWLLLGIVTALVLLGFATYLAVPQLSLGSNAGVNATLPVVPAEPPAANQSVLNLTAVRDALTAPSSLAGLGTVVLLALFALLILLVRKHTGLFRKVLGVVVSRALFIRHIRIGLSTVIAFVAMAMLLSVIVLAYFFRSQAWQFFMTLRSLAATYSFYIIFGVVLLVIGIAILSAMQSNHDTIPPPKAVRRQSRLRTARRRKR